MSMWLQLEFEIPWVYCAYFSIKIIWSCLYASHTVYVCLCVGGSFLNAWWLPIHKFFFRIISLKLLHYKKKSILNFLPFDVIFTAIEMDQVLSINLCRCRCRCRYRCQFQIFNLLVNDSWMDIKLIAIIFQKHTHSHTFHTLWQHRRRQIHVTLYGIRCKKTLFQLISTIEC